MALRQEGSCGVLVDNCDTSSVIAEDGPECLNSCDWETSSLLAECGQASTTSTSSNCCEWETCSLVAEQGDPFSFGPGSSASSLCEAIQSPQGESASEEALKQNPDYHVRKLFVARSSSRSVSSVSSEPTTPRQRHSIPEGCDWETSSLVVECGQAEGNTCVEWETCSMVAEEGEAPEEADSPKLSWDTCSLIAEDGHVAQSSMNAGYRAKISGAKSLLATKVAKTLWRHVHVPVAPTPFGKSVSEPTAKVLPDPGSPDSSLSPDSLTSRTSPSRRRSLSPIDLMKDLVPKPLALCHMISECHNLAQLRDDEPAVDLSQKWCFKRRDAPWDLSPRIFKAPPQPWHSVLGPFH